MGFHRREIHIHLHHQPLQQGRQELQYIPLLLGKYHPFKLIHPFLHEQVESRLRSQLSSPNHILQMQTQCWTWRELLDSCWRRGQDHGQLVGYHRHRPRLPSPLQIIMRQWQWTFHDELTYLDLFWFMNKRREKVRKRRLICTIDLFATAMYVLMGRKWLFHMYFFAVCTQLTSKNIWCIIYLLQ